MSRADSHIVGGDDSSAGFSGGDGDDLPHEKGEAGGEAGFNLKVIMVAWRKRHGVAQATSSIYGRGEIVMAMCHTDICDPFFPSNHDDLLVRYSVRPHRPRKSYLTCGNRLLRAEITGKYTQVVIQKHHAGTSPPSRGISCATGELDQTDLVLILFFYTGQNTRSSSPWVSSVHLPSLAFIEVPMVGINPADRDADGVSSEVPSQQSNRGELGSSLEAFSSTPSTHSPPALVPTPSSNSTARFRDPSWMYHPTGQRFVEQEESPVRSWHMHSVQMNEARLRAKHTSSPPPTSRSASSYQSPKPIVEDEMNQRMRSLSINQRQATLTIDTIVIGGSIAGLATAYALSRVGHRVHVLEKAPSIDQRGIGIRIAPNCSKLLVEWGLGEELSRLAQKCRKSTFRDINTSEVVGVVEWAEDIIQEAGGEFFLILYSDLRRLLYDLAVSNGVRVSLGAKVKSVSADDTKDQPTVTLEDGTIFSADLIIGADGQNSTVREAISGVEPPATDSYDSYYSVVIPGDRMREDPELAEFPDLEEWPMWMGDMRVALAFGTRGGDKYCIHLYWPNKATTYDGPEDEGWETFCSPDVPDLSGCDPRLQKLYKMAEYCIRTKYVVRPPPDEWVHESGRMVLLGEAAHPLLPCSTQGAGMAIEDAAALGSLMSRLRTWDQLPMLLNAFQDLRRDRCMDVGLTELNNATLVTLPPGPTRDGRNASFKQALELLQKAEENGERWSDAQLRDQWDEIGYVFAYNARDAAEDWWVEWGALGEGSKAMMMHDPLNLSFSITTETSSAEPLATQIMAMG